MAFDIQNIEISSELPEPLFELGDEEDIYGMEEARNEDDDLWRWLFVEDD